MFKKLILLFLLFEALTLASPALQAATVSAQLDKTNVNVNEQVRLTIQISDAQGNIQAPRVPAIPGFDIFYTGRASHLTFINNQSSSSIEFNYVLVPQQAGSYNIDPINIQVDGQLLSTSPLRLDVAAGSAAPLAQPPQRAPFGGFTSPSSQSPGLQGPYQNEPAPSLAENQDPNIYVLANADKLSAYPNQQITLTYSLYTRYDTRFEGFEKEPEFSGFWIEEFPMEQEVKREYVNVNGKRYLKADVKKIALFPTAAADYAIQPGVIKASIRKDPQNSSVFDEFFNDSFFSGGTFFSRRESVLLSPPPIKIQVKSFPEEGKPKSFQGAVGNFRLSAEVDWRKVKQDEPVTMKLVIEGEGNIETLNRPEIPELKEFKVYEADASSQLFRQGDTIAGQKIYEIVFIPTQPGQLKIPPLEFSYFNPASLMYNRLYSPELLIEVEKSDQSFALPTPIAQKEEFKKDIEMQGKDIRFIQERLQGTYPEKILDFSVWASGILDLFLVFIYGLTLWKQRDEERLNKNTALKRRRGAKRIALERLKQLNKKKELTEADYFEEIDHILTQYLADKFNLSVYGITRDELQHKLQETLGEKDSLYQEIIKLYQWCDEFRFAKGSISKQDKDKAQKILQDAVNRFERIKA